MRKTITINISGIVFYIEDNAFEVLRSYINKLKEHFGSQTDGDEIIADIESRIAELFQEDLSSNTQAIRLELVQKVIEQLGTPSDFLEEDEEDANPHDNSDDQKEKKKQESNTSANYRVPNKKLYRDPENHVFGGICSGFSYYFNIDRLIIRILFTILLFATSGTFILIYIVLWIALPEARSAAQRLEMRGKAVNIDNIKSSFTSKEGSQKRDSDKQQDASYAQKRPHIRVKSGQAYTVKKKGNNFADVLLSLIKIFFIFIGSIILVSLLVAVFSIVISFFAISGVFPIGTVCLDDLQLLPEVFLSYNGSGFLGVVLVIGIPIFLLVYLISKIAFKHQGKTGWVIVLSFILWFVGIGLLLRTGFGILSDGPDALSRLDERWKNRIELIFGEFQDERQNDNLQTAETYFETIPDTLYINLNANDTLSFIQNYENYMQIDNSNTFFGKPRIHVLAHSNSDGCTIVQKTKSKEGRRTDAYYPVYLKNDTLQLPFLYSFNGAKARPRVDINLKLPSETVFYIIPNKGTKNLASMAWSGESEVKFKEIPGKYLIIKPDGLKLLN